VGSGFNLLLLTSGWGIRMGLALWLRQASTSSGPATTVNGVELREQIRQTIRDATQAAQQAAADAKAAQNGSGHNIVVVPPVPPLPPIGVTTTGTSFDRDMPPRVKDVSIAFFVMLSFVIVGLPLVRAISRRIDRGSQAPPPFPKEVRDHLQQLSQSVDAIAIEVERISEGQRFTTKMLAEKRPHDVTMMPGSTGQ
jgi:hypothetical protein